MNNPNAFANLKEREELEYQVALLDSLNRLKVNNDFNRIYEHYTKESASLLIQKLSSLVKEGKNTDTIHKQLEGISHFMAFLKTIDINGNSANESLNQEEE